LRWQGWRVLGVLLLAPCDGGAATPTVPDASPPKDAAPDQQAARITVTGTEELTFVYTSGTEKRLSDLSATDIGIWAMDSRGGFSFHPGKGDKNGRFAVPDVPEGPFWLRFGHDYFAGSPTDSTFDFGYAFLGHYDRFSATKTPTPFVFSWTGLRPWQVGDQLSLFSIDASIHVARLDIQARPRPLMGTTTLDATLDYAGVPHRLLERGDQVFAVQMGAEKGGGGTSYLAAARSLAANNIRQIDGQSTTWAGAFEPAPLDQAFTLTWDRAAFEELRTEVSPLATSGLVYLEVGALPAEGNVNYDTAPLLQASGLPLDGKDAEGLFAGRYRDPYPDSWSRVATLWFRYSVPVLAPKATSARDVPADFLLTDLADRLTSAAVRPPVGPVRNIRVDGRVATDHNLEGVSITPTVEWEAPVTGKPESYMIEVDHVTSANGRSFLDAEAYLRTDGTRIRLPPEILKHFEWYVLRISALVGGSRATRPYRRSLPYGASEALTAQLRP
jgi:hypothetical protein